jgi:DNA-binding MarR family transcriptional regulator
LSLEIRRNNAGTTLFLQAVADRAGLNITDLQVLGLLELEGPTTAGSLAKETGLSTGAITRLVDRLEKAGFVQRVRPPEDRRKVVIEPVVSQTRARIDPLFDGMVKAWTSVLDDYDEEHLRELLEVFTRMNPVLRAEISRLR